MAAAVTGREVWRRQGVRGAEVAEALRHLGQGGRARGRPEIRSSTANLVVRCRDEAEVRRLEGVMARWPGLRPSRIVLVAQVADGSGLDAWIRVAEPAAAGGPRLVSDQVALVERGQSGQDLTSLVIPLLLPDLPVVLYWPGGAPFGHPWWEAWWEGVDRLVVDSRAFLHPRRDLAGLRAILAAGAPQVADLGWESLRPGREALALACDDPEGLRMLGALEAVEVAPEGDGALWSTTHLLWVGWVAACLGLTARGADLSHPLTAGSRPVGLGRALDVAGPALALTGGGIRRGAALPPPHGDPVAQEALELAAALAHGRDPVWEEAVRLAAELAARLAP